MEEKICKLNIPADEDFAVLARSFVVGCCSIYGMYMDIVEDIKIACDEAIVCLINQPRKAVSIDIDILDRGDGIVVEFTILSSSLHQERDKSDVDITRGILEVLVPRVNICSDHGGVFCISFFFPKN